MALRNIIIIGAGGNLGRKILSALDSDPQITVSVLTRASSYSTFPQHIPVYRIGDCYPAAELIQAFKGQDAIVSAVGIGAIQQQKLFIDAAIKAGVKRFIPSEFGTDTRNTSAYDILPQFTKAKADIITYLESREHDGLTWSAIINGPFLDLGLVNFLGYKPVTRQATILNDGSHRFSGTTRAVVGLAVKNTLLTPETTANRYLFIDSVTASQNEFLSLFEKSTGEESWTVVHVNAEKEKQAALYGLSKGDFSYVPKLVRYIICVDGYGGNYLDYEESANKLLGLPHSTADELVYELMKESGS